MSGWLCCVIIGHEAVHFPFFPSILVFYVVEMINNVSIRVYLM